MTAVIMLGPPGVGKGTQAAKLAKRLGVPAISTGQIFRANIAEQTELGQLADGYISRGEFVPDSVTIPMVAARLQEEDVREHGFVLDGFPRNLEQALALDELLTELGMPVDVALEFSASRERLLERLANRAQHESRADDTPEVFLRRLKVYYELTEPLSKYYEDHGVLGVVDASGSAEEVGDNMYEALRKRNIYI